MANIIAKIRMAIRSRRVTVLLLARCSQKPPEFSEKCEDVPVDIRYVSACALTTLRRGMRIVFAHALFIIGSICHVARSGRVPENVSDGRMASGTGENATSARVDEPGTRVPLGAGRSDFATCHARRRDENPQSIHYGSDASVQDQSSH